MIKNPSLKEMAQIRADSLDPEGVVRGFVFDNGDVVVWDGYAATHSEVEAEMYISGIPIFLKPDLVEIRRLSNDERTMNDMTEIKANKTLNHLYGSDIQVIATDEY